MGSTKTHGIEASRKEQDAQNPKKSGESKAPAFRLTDAECSSQSKGKCMDHVILPTGSEKGHRIGRELRFERMRPDRPDRHG